MFWDLEYKQREVVVGVIAGCMLYKGKGPHR